MVIVTWAIWNYLTAVQSITTSGRLGSFQANAAWDIDSRAIDVGLPTKFIFGRKPFSGVILLLLFRPVEQ